MSKDGAANRKARRAAAAKKSGVQSSQSSTIPLAKPPAPSAAREDLPPTLIDEINRRAAEAEARAPQIEADVRVGYALIMAALMLVVHATLAALARKQYGQDVTARIVAREALLSAPVFGGLVYMLHPLTRQWAQALAALVSVGIGCWLVFLVNEEGYYASMSKAPALGSLWVWLYTELEWYWGTVSLVAVGAYLYANGYAIVQV